jgi:RimJ/RimL family protein N-acetyltransferase
MNKLSSARYLYRDALIDDATFFLTLLNDENWLRFIGDRNVQTLLDAESFIIDQVKPMYSSYGLGMKVICDKQTGERLGLIGLLKRDYLDSIDLGYALLQSARGKGVIAESVPIFTNIAFKEIESTILYATVDPDNFASIRVLQKNNFCLAPNPDAFADLPRGTMLYVRYRNEHDFCKA